MLQTEQWMDIHFRFRRFGSIRAVAKQTATRVTRFGGLLRSDSPPVFDRPVRKTGIEDSADYLTQQFTEYGLSAERLLAEIRPQGFAGSVWMFCWPANVSISPRLKRSGRTHSSNVCRVRWRPSRWCRSAVRVAAQPIGSEHRRRWVFEGIEPQGNRL